MIKNNLNPVWNEAFLIVPGPDGRIEIKVTDSLELLLCLSTLHRISETRSNQVFDSDAGTVVNGTDDLLGIATFSTNDVPSGGWLDRALPLGGHPKAKGTVNIKIRHYSDPTFMIQSAKSLRNADGMFGTSDPCEFSFDQNLLKITCQVHSCHAITCPTSHSVPCQDVKVLGLCSSRNAGRVWGRTAVVQNNLNPTWAAEAFTLNLFTVMPSGGKLSPLIIEVG